MAAGALRLIWAGRKKAWVNLQRLGLVGALTRMESADAATGCVTWLADGLYAVGAVLCLAVVAAAALRPVPLPFTFPAHV